MFNKNNIIILKLNENNKYSLIILNCIKIKKK